MSKRRWVPYLLAGIAAVVIIVMLSPIAAPTGKYRPLILGLPYTVMFWAIGSLVVSALCILLGVWALKATK